MKFGETIHQRSVQKWAAYKVKYNDLKYLIKDRTSKGAAVPLAIPTAGAHRWQSLEDDLFPETAPKVFSSMYDSLSRGKQTVVSWFPITLKIESNADGVRTPLLFDQNKRQGSFEADLDSSGSDTDDFLNKDSKRRQGHSFSSVFPSRYRSRQPLSRRQRALERSLFQFYTGLMVVSYVLLIMAGLLENSGRKKKALEVDAGVIAGVAVAEAYAAMSVVLICMRRKRLGSFHWGVILVNVAVIAVIGVAELTMMFAGRS